MLVIFGQEYTIKSKQCPLAKAELNYWVARNKRLHKQSKNEWQHYVNEFVISQLVNHLRVEKLDTPAAQANGELRAHTSLLSQEFSITR